MPRLPQVGQEKNNWGTLLNEYLLREHAEDGTHGHVNASSVTTGDLLTRGPWVDVRAFGAKGIGTDDTVAIKNAIQHAVETGGVVYLPAGQYLCGPLMIEGVAIVGSGVLQDPSGNVPNRGTQLRIVDESEPFITITGGSVVLEGLNFFYPEQKGTRATPIEYHPTVQFRPNTKIADLRISNCSFVNSYTALVMAALDRPPCPECPPPPLECPPVPPPCPDPYAVGRIRVEKSNIYGIHEAIRIENARDAVSISDCILGPNAYSTATPKGSPLGTHTANQGRGVSLRRADGVTLSNTLIHGYATGIQAQDTYSLRVVQCLFECAKGIQLEGTNTFAVNGCGFWTAHKYDNTKKAYSVWVEPTGAFTTGVLSGNAFHYAEGEHVCIMAGSHHCVVTVTGNTFRSWGRFANRVEDAAALRVSSPQAFVHCSGNTFRGEAASSNGIYGVLIDQADAVSVQGNQFFACWQAVRRTGAGACMVSGNMVRATGDSSTSISIEGSSSALVANNMTDIPGAAP